MLPIGFTTRLAGYLSPKEMLNLHLTSSSYYEQMKDKDLPRCVVSFIEHFLEKGKLSPLVFKFGKHFQIDITVTRSYLVVDWATLCYPPFLFNNGTQYLGCCQRFLKGSERYAKKYVSNYCNEYMVTVSLPTGKRFRPESVITEQRVLYDFFKTLLLPKREFDNFGTTL